MRRGCANNQNYAHDFCLLGRTGFADDFAEVTKDGKALEGRNVAAPLVVIGDRRAIILDAGFRISVENRDQSIGLREGKRTKQNRIDHGEDREVRPEADRDRGQRGEGEAGRLEQLPESETETIYHDVDLFAA